MKRTLPLAMLLAFGLAPMARAANEADYKAAYAAAEATAKEAEALAKASIFQATSEKEAWKAMEIR